jgi:hypothetical protein
MTTDALDREALRQLDRCRVPHDTGPFTFAKSGHRGYWVVNGPVPLHVAQAIYDDPASPVIRVDGHCGCVAPVEPWITYRMPDGTTLATLKDQESLDKIAHINPEHHQEYAKRYTFSDDPKVRAKAKAYVETYHIDNEMGLRVFVDYLRWNGLI